MSVALKECLVRYMDARGGDGLFDTPIHGLFLMSSNSETLPHPMLYRPALCVIVQGAKQVMLGEAMFRYRAMQALIVSVELPMIGKVTQADESRPFLGLNLDLDINVFREVMAQLDEPPRPTAESAGVYVDDLNDALADALLRLVRLLDTPKAIPVLAPLIVREVAYLLLTGTHAGEVCKLALPDGHTQRIASAIRVLRESFAKTIRTGQLARAARMSVSTFHQHFKALTAMTPLQYQKQLRLLEARRLMLAGDTNAAGAAYQVGYESASQFSREYARMFGAPPRREVSETRELQA